MLPFREHGRKDAPVVFLLLHFFGGSHREWTTVIQHMGEEHRCVAADMAGFGEAASLEGYSVSEMCVRIRELLHYLDPTPVVLVGHSMSGKAAMVVAAEPPRNLAGVVLVAPSPLAGEPMTDKARADMRIANTTRERAEAFTRKGFAKQPDDETFEVAVEDVLRSNDHAFRSWADQGTREDWSDRIKQFGTKTLLVVGEEDKAIDPELQKRETLPLVLASGGRLHLMAGCAHLLPYEAPEDLSRLLQVFAEEVTGTS
jgi:pimeloyl-ACP methyl ester carboxylesterase